MARFIPGSLEHAPVSAVPRRTLLRALGGGGLITTAALGGLGLARPEHAVAAAEQRPISDFLDAQGANVTYVPPIRDFIGWGNNPTTYFASVDYAALAHEYLHDHGYDLGTETAGKVTERPLKDGRAEVKVVLHTTNALAWAIEIDPDVDFLDQVKNKQRIFGYLPTELLADATLQPALGGSQFGVVFKNTAPGAPLPDLVVAFLEGNALEGQELLSLSFRASAFGALRAPTFADGTPGKLTITQTGLFHTGSHGKVGDPFPAERVELREVGSGVTSESVKQERSRKRHRSRKRRR